MKVFNDSGLVKAWVDGVDLDDKTIEQISQVAKLPFVFKWVALMPDGHVGKGATVGSVIPTKGAVIPAAVGVDIGCGMISKHLDFKVDDKLKEELPRVRQLIEDNIPTGRSDHGRRNDIGAWGGKITVVPDIIKATYDEKLQDGYRNLQAVEPDVIHERAIGHLGTLGTGNHFIELETDENNDLWITIHSGSRGPGAKIGNHFMRKAQEIAEEYFITQFLPNKDLAYLPKNSDAFRAYWLGLQWAQKYAWYNRELMLYLVECVLDEYLGKAKNLQTVHCHHNYARLENHFGQNIFITRKGAISAKEDEWGIIPGSMGAKTFIVQGKGEPDAFKSASHGAGRKMSRRKALDTFTVEDHAQATLGVECNKESGVLDETPGAYKDIDAVMAAQSDLVDIRYTLRPILCVKGVEK